MKLNVQNIFLNGQQNECDVPGHRGTFFSLETKRQGLNPGQQTVGNEHDTPLGKSKTNSLL